MVAYTGIQGQNILIVSSDPANPVEGQIWYNSTSNLLKGYQYVATNAWASGGTYPVSKQFLGSLGIETAALAYGGSFPYIATTALYNGTSWTNNPTGLNTARDRLESGGTQTAGLGFGGYVGGVGNQTASESWNGSTWTNTPSLNTARRSFGGCGTQTTALAFGGIATAATAVTESWNGSSWTTLPATMNTGRGQLQGNGTQTAALAFGGLIPPRTAATESWNGSSWTSVNSMNTARGYLSGAGTQTATLGFGGYALPGNTRTAATESWNGTSWTNTTSLPATNSAPAGAGTQTSALSIAGNGAAGYLNTTNEWSGSQLAVKTITVS